MYMFWKVKYISYLEISFWFQVTVTRISNEMLKLTWSANVKSLVFSFVTCLAVR